MGQRVGELDPFVPGHYSLASPLRQESLKTLIWRSQPIGRPCRTNVTLPQGHHAHTQRAWEEEPRSLDSGPGPTTK